VKFISIKDLHTTWNRSLKCLTFNFKLSLRRNSEKTKNICCVCLKNLPESGISWLAWFFKSHPNFRGGTQQEDILTMNYSILGITLDSLVRAAALGVLVACLFGYLSRLYFALFQKKESDQAHWTLEAILAALIAFYADTPANGILRFITFFVCLGASLFWKLPPFRCLWRQSFATVVAVIALTAALKPVTAGAFAAALLVSMAYWTKNRNFNIGTIIFTLTVAVAFCHFGRAWVLLPLTLGCLLERAFLHRCFRDLRDKTDCQEWRQAIRAARCELIWQNFWTFSLIPLVSMLAPALATVVLVGAAPMALLFVLQCLLAQESTYNDFLWRK